MSVKSELHQGVVLAVAIDPDGPLVGTLLLGAPGSGKSSLALSLIEDCQWRRSGLVADDVFLIDVRDEALIAHAPAEIAGLIEIRGYGPVEVRALRRVSLLAGFDLSVDAERISEPAHFAPSGAPGKGVPIWPFRQSAAAPSRIRPILRAILSGQNR